MRQLIFTLSFVLLLAGSAQAQPQLFVSPAEVPSGGAVTVTITAPPGYYWALVGSTRDGGFSYGGVALGVGADAAVLATGVVGPGGTVSMPFTPPLGGGLDVYYLMAAISLDPSFVPPIPSATVAMRPRGFYSNTPVFPQGLSAGGATVHDLGWPSAATDSAPKGYVDTMAALLSSGAAQAVNNPAPLLNLEQLGSGDLLNLRTNSTTVAGYSGTNPNRTQFRVLPDGGFFAAGDYGRGVIPVQGAGSRLMWYPRKGAFRAGRAAGTEWDDANVDDYSVAFGNQVTASDYGAVAFGDQVTVSSTVGFGAGSGITVSGTAGTGFGASHVVSGFAAGTIGYSNIAAGQGSMAFGYRVNACNDYSVALGYRASTSSAPALADACGGTTHTGSFAFSDESSSSIYLHTTANNQMAMRFAGGYRFYTNAAKTVGVSLTAGGSSWNVISDRNVKFDVEPVDGGDILQRLLRVPINTFSYKEGDGTRYIGPMAQDFHAAFGLGDDDKTIRMNDIDGVALASIQALAREVTRLREENELLREQAAAIDALERRLQKLEHALVKQHEPNQ